MAVPVNPQFQARAKTGNLLRLTLNDSDDRAMGYLAGYAPNHWGIDAEGVYIGHRLAQGPLIWLDARGVAQSRSCPGNCQCPSVLANPVKIFWGGG